MAGDPRVQELLEELLESGHTPEEVCQHAPELLPKVLARLHRLRACDVQLVRCVVPANRTHVASGQRIIG
jgi:hypothetical protein